MRYFAKLLDTSVSERKGVIMSMLGQIVIALLAVCLVFLVIMMFFRRAQKSNLNDFCAAHSIEFTPEPLWQFHEAGDSNYSSETLGVSVRIFAKKTPVSWQEVKSKIEKSFKMDFKKIIVQSEQTIEVHGVLWQTIVYQTSQGKNYFGETYAYCLFDDGYISFELMGLAKEPGSVLSEVERIPVYLDSFSKVS
jgi:hypothetical protein